MIRADLHIHSQYSSDGEFRPADIVGKCAAGGVDLFALTDHNTVRGLDEACDGALQAGLEFVPGIEIDCSFEGTDLHLLGYRIDWKSPDFFAVDEQAVLAAAAGKLPTLELIAEVMLSDPACDTPLLAPYRKGGARGDMPYINFYLDFGAQGRPAFVPVEYMSFRDAVELVRNNGGVPVVAHPGLNLRGRERIVEKLLERGAEGLEVFNNYHDDRQIAYFAPLVRRRGALMTCGSDFHGKTKPLIHVGRFGCDARWESSLADSVARLAKGV